MKEEWLMSGAAVPVDVETTAALVVEIKRLIDVVGGMALVQPAQQEPVGNLRMGPRQDFVTTSAAGELEINVWHPVYTSPPAQRTWVGLTDEEAFQICVDCGCLSEDWLTLLDAIEAKLRSKNT